MYQQSGYLHGVYKDRGKSLDSFYELRLLYIQLLPAKGVQCALWWKHRYISRSGMDRYGCDYLDAECYAAFNYLANVLFKRFLPQLLLKHKLPCNRSLILSIKWFLYMPTF